MFIARCLRFAALLTLFSLAIPALAQKAPQHPPYTLREHVREVLTDVVVTDTHGNPINGLPQSAFHIYDNGHPQTIRSFTAHSGSNLAVQPSSSASGVYSNRYLTHPPAVYNIALIDLTTMSVFEQMALRKQLVQFLQHLSPNQPLAVYMRYGRRIVLVQNFTTSRKALLAAVRHTIPRVLQGGISGDTDPAALRQMADELSQYPGRKNLIWFSGGSNLFLLSTRPGAKTGLRWHPQASVNMHPLFDTLAAERIAVYPVDVRGLVGLGAHMMQIMGQNELMNSEAAATGGHAYENINGIAQVAHKILKNSADFY